ncbi:DNA repair protein RAD51 2 [Caerostris extrusa]|uniref:DNA repair protein RAD51 2 n=1 Tax=Caerostris extrusa TaxID=172846 RepID=A0AAV4P2S8_CAEEX|nr:DNA repair protein RAD51 2 [Caerostris extrusa]
MGQHASTAPLCFEQLVESINHLKRLLLDGNPGRAWFRSTDLWVMGPARFHCATLLTEISTKVHLCQSVVSIHGPLGYGPSTLPLRHSAYRNKYESTSLQSVVSIHGPWAMGPARFHCATLLTEISTKVHLCGRPPAPVPKKPKFEGMDADHMIPALGKHVVSLCEHPPGRPIPGSKCAPDIIFAPWWAKAVCQLADSETRDVFRKDYSAKNSTSQAGVVKTAPNAAVRYTINESGIVLTDDDIEFVNVSSRHFQNILTKNNFLTRKLLELELFLLPQLCN